MSGVDNRNGSDSFRPWELKWQPEHIERFWNWWSSNPALEHHYFSKRAGDSILNQVSRHIRLAGVAVDLGAGPGYMVDKLIQRDVDTLAVDTSAESVAMLNNRLGGRSHFLGARVSASQSVPLDESTADVVLLVEMIEHLDDMVLQGIINEVRRITKPGGYVVITTPNEEELAGLQTICPNCGCVYHTYQHMRSLSANMLRQLMQSVGFVQMICRPTLFSRFAKPLQPLHRLAYSVTRHKLPHLLYIGRNSK